MSSPVAPSFVTVLFTDVRAALAAEPVRSESTVKTHVGRVLGELRLHDRAQAVLVTSERGPVARDV
jgi:hypothetical protein